MSSPPPPPGLGGPVGGRCKQVATTITNYCHADLLSGVATVIQPATSTITADAPTIRPKLSAYYQHDHPGSWLANDVPSH
jgi:hypothetical protein